MTTESDRPPLFELTVVPLAWTVIRQYRNGFQSEPAKWLKATHLPKDSQALVDAIESYLARDDGLVDLGSWVMEDLPPRVAHMVDTSTDLLWTLVILLTAKAVSSGGNPSGIQIGPALHSRRSDALRVIDETGERADAIERDFGLRDFGAALPQLRSTFLKAFEDYDAREDQATISKPLSPAKIEQLRSALVDEWMRGFPRSLLAASGSIVVNGKTPTPRETLRIGSWMPREILQEDTSFVDDSPRHVGEGLAQALARGESSALGRSVGTSRPYRRGSSLPGRIRAARKAIPGATHLLIPYSFPVIRALGIQEFGELREWNHEGLVTREWHDVPPNCVVLLRLPDAILVREPQDFRTPSVLIAEVDANRAAELAAEAEGETDHPDPVRYWRTRVHVEARVPWRFKINRKAIRAVEIPTPLRD